MEIGIGLGITRFPGWGVMNIGQLFASGEQGAWYDPSDMSTLFQDSAGTVPVTAVGQPVGFILDKRLGLARSPLSIVGKTAGDGVATVVGNVITVTGGASSTDVSFSNGYSFTLLDLTFSAANGITVFAEGYPSMATAGRNTYRGAVGIYNLIRVPAGAPTTTITVHDAYRIIGNHATQATATARPVLQQDGNGKYYLAFDGVDDSMATAAINFTATDKMTVWAGVRSNLNGYSNILELGPNSASENGFSLQRGFAANGDYVGIAYGTSLGYGYTSNFAAPDTSVITAQYDLAQASALTGELEFRRNGVVAALANINGAAGTGNFSQKPLYIGGRAGTSFHFNGRIYQLVVRGAATPLADIEAAESFIADKTGITL